ncbi:DUF3833 family protein [Ancylobacter polymorphus]|jgi:hypothetical protein|uniref:DUF3833 domain-containing protein n=1 Tax=Ancylobacter polymorphus TaxID=223390 RepID=A0ABU0B5S0_9HYPH|nr:DUF3833 family protein [Ancylobacter polymorphus]MDQ0301170.1 hypothetical protein [Ancylobacter polymorphus]
MKRLLLLAGIFAFAGLGTSAVQARDLVLEQYFAGRTVAEGSFSAINGVRRSFTVDLTGRWNGNVLTLVEDFHFADGEKDRKTWRFEKLGPGRYRGTREDVRGATEVTVKGDTATFSYLLDLDPGAGENLVRFHDKMVLREDGTVLNTAWVTKYGFPVALTRVTFRHP